MSNAPDLIYKVMQDDSGGTWETTYTRNDVEAAEKYAANMSLGSSSWSVVPYVRLDLAVIVPDEIEIAKAIAPYILHSGVQRWQLTDAAAAVKRLLQNRIEDLQ